MSRCVAVGGALVMFPSVDCREVRTAECPWELSARACLFELEEWYGVTLTCLTCGYQWGDRLPPLTKSEAESIELAEERRAKAVARSSEPIAWVREEPDAPDAPTRGGEREE
jgi:hypothetical protein